MPVFHANSLKDLDDLLAAHKVIVVDFTATWCGPCKMITPVVEKLSQSKGVALVKVDIDKATQLADSFKVNSVPTFYVLKDNRSNVVETCSGANFARCQQLFAIAASLL